MDQNGFDFKALRMNTTPTEAASSNPPFSMLQRPTNSRKPFAFIQTQSRNNAENHCMPSTSQIPQFSGSSRRPADPSRMKQEPSESHLPMFPNARNHQQQQHSLMPLPRNEVKTQSHSTSHKLRAFAMMAPAHNEQPSQQLFDAPQYSSSPKLSSFKSRPESHNYPHSSIDQSQQRLISPSIPQSRSPSVQFDPGFDAEDADLSQLMTKRMREAKMVKSKLAEERLATAALESRLSAQAAASEASELALQNRISALEAREASRQAQADEELRAAQSKIEEAETKLKDTTTRLNDTRATAKRGLDQLGTNYAALQAFLKDLKSDYNASQDAVKCMSEELSEIRRNAIDGVKGIETSESLSRGAETRALIDELQSDRASAHQVIDMLRDKLHLLSAQVVEARERVAELESIREGKIERIEIRVEELADKLVKKEEEGVRGLADALALEARLEETNDRLLEISKTLEKKEVELRTFRKEKVGWEWELKDKCARIASLQASSADVAALKEENINLEYQVREKCSRISALQTVETELMTLKKEKTTLECEVKENHAKITAFQNLQTDTMSLKEEKVALECQLKESRCKITAHEDLQRDTSVKLHQLKDQAHQQDIQLLQLRAELKSVENAKEQLQSSLEASQQSAIKFTQEVHALTLREAVLQEKSGELGVQLSKLVAEVGKLKSEALTCVEELKQANTRNSVLQERFDSQTLTLKLAKEQSGDLQERLLVSESSHATKLESTTGKFNVEIAVLREQKAGLQATINQVTEEATTQRAAFVGASVDYENKLSKQEETHAKLVQAEERRAIAAERDVADAKRLVDDLMQQIESVRAELEDVKKKSREVASRENIGMEGEVVVLRARLEELEGENSRLEHRARMLHKRYKDGDLSDSEKIFVNSLMQMSQSIHEQDIVAKENELRRRENMITSLQTRIDTLESTLARLLKERGKESDPNSKSMVDLSLWMSSSPRSAQKKPGAPAAASSSSRIQPQSPTVFAPDTPPPVKKSSKATKPADIKPPPPPTAHRVQKTLAAIDADEDPLTDSDDETPLSALGKRSRTPTSAKTDDARPTRRVRAAASRKVDVEADKKPAEKSKQRKRR
ncbi:hypothetical protein C8R44DRAFT_244833 [Mycena epipterygia]|nr:hypothetical protein C8R44DRAFT_244833 [Mycena epipterygia]